MGLGDLNKELAECKGESLAVRKKIIHKIHCEKAKLIRDKAKVVTPYIIEEGVLPSFISTDYNSIKDYAKVVGPLAKQFSKSSGMEIDDLEQEGMIAYCKALDEYPSRTVKKTALSSYIWMYVKNAMIDYSRKQERWDRMEYRDNIDETVLDELRLNPEEECLKKEQVDLANAKVRELQAQLNERELFVFWHTIMAEDPMTYRDMGDQFDCSKDAISRDFQRIKALLRGTTDGRE